MSRVTSPVTGKSYGLATVCRVWRLARSGVYRRLSPTPAAPPQRRGPTGAMTDAALTAAIRAVLAASPFHGEGHRKVWARLRHAGTRTSLRRVLRLMRENDLLAPSRVGSARGPRAHDGTIIPETVDTMWGTDLTATFTGEGQAAVFIAVDHCSAECVGIHPSSGIPTNRSRLVGTFASFAHARHPLRGVGADPSGGAPPFRRVRCRRRARIEAATRPRLAIHVRSLPEGDRLPWHREFSRLRARSGRKGLRRAVHPHAQGEPALGQDL
jgi:HTH-like domain